METRSPNIDEVFTDTPCWPRIVTERVSIILLLWSHGPVFSPYHSWKEEAKSKKNEDVQIGNCRQDRVRDQKEKSQEKTDCVRTQTLKEWDKELCRAQSSGRRQAI